MKRLSVGELAQHLHESEPDARQRARQIAAEMAESGNIDLAQHNTAVIRNAIRGFENNWKEIFPSSGGYGAVMHELIRMNAVKKLREPDAPQKKKKRYEI